MHDGGVIQKLKVLYRINIIDRFGSSESLIPGPPSPDFVSRRRDGKGVRYQRARRSWSRSLKLGGGVEG